MFYSPSCREGVSLLENSSPSKRKLLQYVPGSLYSGLLLTMDEHSEPEPGQPSPEQSDQLLHEFMQELRIVLPGVQVLFAFLLTSALSARNLPQSAVRTVATTGRRLAKRAP
jgi:hypothetical protein